MPAYLCTTCGVQYAPSDHAHERCPICEDERQYVGWAGQRWTTLYEMRASGTYRTEIKEEEPRLYSLRTEPKVGIGQQALLVQTPAGNVLWDCLTYLDDATIKAIQELGGIQAIAISHPHFYGANVDWSEAFRDAPVYAHADDREWVMDPSPNLVLWEGDTLALVDGLTLLHLGGHFDGAAVLHWPAGANGRGVLLTGDTIQVVMDRRHVSFMYSYPNLVPLSPEQVRGIADRVKPYPFDRIYGAFGGRNVLDNAADAVERSAVRYVRYSRGEA